MKNAWIALLSSRKWWTGFLTISAIATATFLVHAKMLETAQLVPTIGAITAIGISVIGSIAWEDSSAKKSAANTTISASATVPEKRETPREDS